MLEIAHLRTFWARIVGQRNATSAFAEDDSSWVADTIMLRGLHVGLHETLAFLYGTGPSLDQFNAWILERNEGAIEPERLRAINAAINGVAVPLDVDETDDGAAPPLSSEDLAFWDEHGYVVLRNAVTADQARDAVEAICDFLKMDLGAPETWYDKAQGVNATVPLVHHPALWANRRSPRIRRAFAQLWKRSDLWVSVDQCGMNPPETPTALYAGTGLHWDVSLEPPIPLGIQGELYLSDTAENQGAFTCIPGFHRTIDAWLQSLPPHVDPRSLDLTQFGPVAVPGNAGDMIIWHQALPHAGSPNRASEPRIVQFIRLTPSQYEQHRTWL